MFKLHNSIAWGQVLHGTIAVALIAAALPAAAQDASSLVLPGQPFNSAPPSTSASPGLAAQAPSEESDGLGGYFSAHAGLSRTFTDNLYYTADGDPNKVQAFGWAFQPIVAYQNSLPLVQFRALGGATLQTINSPGQHDDSADGMLSTAVFWEPLAHDRIGLDGSLVISHDPFGTNRTEGGVINTAQLDDWRLGSVALDWLHGESIRGLSVEGSISALDKTYFTNQEFSSYLDYNELIGQGVVYYAITPKTQVLADVSATRIQTPNLLSFPSINYHEPDQGGMLYQWLGGVRWQATAKTSGDVRLGWLKRDFNGDSQPSYSGFDWQATLRWNPKPYRNFSVDAGESSQQSYLASAGFINDRSVAANWSEHWSPLFTTRLTANYVNLKFVNSVPSRSDENYYGGLFMQYQATRGVSLFATGAFGRRDSNQPGVDYSRSDIFAGIKLAISSE